MHCHILLHEDIGMMMVVNIVPQGSLLRIIASTVKANEAYIGRLSYLVRPDILCYHP